ncbi:acyl-CoA dehydrogenase [Streptomyces sp. NRRL F-4489]|uniref:acyl-CoA dehydrogenase family protein n=1 Tax=Streptomyces sp. NRRL F-4489 TaxID=1609095 RepID=UPI00074A0DB7|nr:acyl-CoA dehydrogenase family protein [Streptomyces sp. NRRL F-4489]KUL48819.1 acyl-CoA dehydrogenase [Streptomyces sp. NRRL F-4489]
MDFTPTEEQRAARDLAAEVFGDLATPERLAELGPSADAALWKALCAAGLPGAAEETGLLGLVLMLEEQGRTTAQVPFAASCVYGLLALGAHGSEEQRARLLPGLRDGTEVATGAFTRGRGLGVVARGGWDGSLGAAVRARLTGVVPVVPWLCAATLLLVPDAERRLWLVRTGDPGVGVEPVATTAPWSAGRLTLDGAPAEALGDGPVAAPPVAGPAPARPVDGSSPTPPLADPDRAPTPYDDILATARTAFAGLQAGVCAGALARAVAHTTTREQFGRPLAANQAVQLRAAEAYMDTEAIRVTAYEAAWRRDAGLPAGTHALTAAWWASEAGKRVVHTGQHLHGGLGADLDHPVHRHFLWGRQLDAHLGAGAELLEELGELLTNPTERTRLTEPTDPTKEPQA